MAKETVTWNQNENQGVAEKAYQTLSSTGGLVVSPTKVGYVLVASDLQGLERKFDAKQRKRNKPGVVLCASIDQLKELAQLNPEIETLYQRHWDEDILLGCILPWKKEAQKKYIPEGAQELMTDTRNTSCFVIKYGTPTENMVRKLWETDKKLCFASSANPSGVGNKGKVEGIGERIENEADIIVSANEYVASIQPARDDKTRYEQGVMVSLVDENGTLVPEQKGERQISPAPILIRKGLDVDKIMSHLSDIFLSWDYRHGQYY